MKNQRLVEMRNIHKAFGGVHAVEDVTVDLYRGEVVGLVGHNGAGKSTLIKILSGVFQADSGQIFIEGEEATIRNPRDARRYGIETIYQNLALADNLDAPANIFLGRELMRGFALNEDAMEAESRKVLDRLRIRMPSLRESVINLSGGQRQAVAIGRALHFNARILIMDEPTAALGPAEARQVGQLIKQLKAEGVGIFLISHDIHDVFEYADRISVLKTGRLVGTVRKTEVTTDDVLTMIIAGQLPHRGVVTPAPAQQQISPSA
jgi:D-xylose transport system ATP-binding protein